MVNTNSEYCLLIDGFDRTVAPTIISNRKNESGDEERFEHLLVIPPCGPPWLLYIARFPTLTPSRVYGPVHRTGSRGVLFSGAHTTLRIPCAFLASHKSITPTFMQDGSFVFSGDDDSEIQIFSAKTGSLCHHASCVNDLSRC